MRRGGGPRPEGSDGSDFSFRMTVDDRYKKAAKGKVLLRKYLNAQAGFLLLRTLMLLSAAASGGVHPDNVQVATCVAAASAVVIGTLGLKKGAAVMLRVYIFLMGLSVGLAAVPLTTGAFLEKMSHTTELRSSRDYKKLTVLVLEGLQEILGTLINVMGLSVAANLVGHLSPPKRKKEG